MPTLFPYTTLFRSHDRDQHPGSTDLVAAPRRRGVRQEPQRQDERHDRDQVQQVGDVATQALGSGGFSRFLNISSIRSVTTKPPTTLPVPSATAASETTRNQMG